MKHIPSILIAASAALVMSGCSLFQKSHTISGAQGTATSGATASSAAKPTDSKPAAPSGAETLPPAVESPSAMQDAPVYPAAVNATKHNLDGEWLMVQIAGQTIDRDEDMPYIIFDPSGRFYANNGCNTVNGSYTLSSEDKFIFSAIMTTMRYCPDQDMQHAVSTVLADGNVSQAKFSEIGTESFIDLAGPSGKTVIRLRRANIDFLNGHWEVLAVNGTSVDPDDPADIFFDIAERKIHGNTGCNYFNGEIYLDHRRSNAIDFSKMGVTRMACPFTAQETALLVALEETTTALSGGKDSAMLLDGEGRELVILRRLPAEE